MSVIVSEGKAVQVKKEQPKAKAKKQPKEKAE